MRFPVRFWTALGGVLSTGVAWVALFVVPLTPEGQAATIALGNAIILTLTTLMAEGEVTPLADVRLAAGTQYSVVAKDDPTRVLDVKTATTR